MERRNPIWQMIGLLYRAHPWHGLDFGERFPQAVNSYIEIVPSDTMKFELDKITGILKVDRPQRFSNYCPAPYGFIPRTLCATRVGDFCSERTGRPNIIGDGDPIDICVLTESNINQGNIFLSARPIGGLRMIDGNEADDKIIGILDGDLAYDGVNDVSQLPARLVDRIRHYFLTYKSIPGEVTAKTEITHIYGRDECIEVIRRSRLDYNEAFGNIGRLHDQIIQMTNDALKGR